MNVSQLSVTEKHRLISTQSFKEKMALMSMNVIKRERYRSQEKERKKKEMRAALPILTRDEIRRHRLPYHEAIVSELDSTGHPSAAEFLRQLLEYQELMRQEHGPDTVVWNRPQLCKNKTHLDTFFQGLSKAEEYNMEGDIGGEIDELLKLAVQFSFGSDDWWWLGEQLMIQCINISSNFEDDGRRREALSRFLYGKFYVENMNDTAIAQHHLEIARELCLGMPWNAVRELGTKETIYIQCCILLYKALMSEAEVVIKYNMPRAIKLSMRARKRAGEACYHEGETAALLFKGKCERMLGDTGAAIASFQRALSVQLKHESPTGICEARVQLALAYIRHGNTELALQELQLLMEYAKEHDLQHYIAQAYRYLGMHHITSGSPAKATPLLIKALNLFHEQNNLIEMEQVRNFAAISTAQELLPRYTHLLVTCDKRGVISSEKMRKLCRWKDVREIFWVDDVMSQDTFYSGSAVGSSFIICQDKQDGMDDMSELYEGDTLLDHFVNARESMDSSVQLLSKADSRKSSLHDTEKSSRRSSHKRLSKGSKEGKLAVSGSKSITVHKAPSSNRSSKTGFKLSESGLSPSALEEKRKSGGSYKSSRSRLADEENRRLSGDPRSSRDRVLVAEDQKLSESYMPSNDLKPSEVDDDMNRKSSRVIFTEVVKTE